jgi:hypothetical protein
LRTFHSSILVWRLRRWLCVWIYGMGRRFLIIGQD